MNLRVLTSDDMETVREWRHGAMASLRTPYALTAEMQQEYYRDVICKRGGTTRYWGLWLGANEQEIEGELHYQIGMDGSPCAEMFIGYGGIENIEWESRMGEISLLIGPQYREKGYGETAVRLFLDQAFHYMNLEYVYGECYFCGPAAFWKKMADYYKADTVNLPCRKYWNGVYYNSFYFCFSKDAYEKTRSGA